MGVMKAISLWQPWASLWLSPSKIHETRHWQTPHRGEMLVHAAKRLVTDVDEELAEILFHEFGADWAKSLPRGAIVGVVDLIDVVPTKKIYMNGFIDSADMVCGDFSDGRFGWKRGSYRRFESPIPWRGRQTIFNVPREAVAEQLAKAEVRQ